MFSGNILNPAICSAILSQCHCICSSPAFCTLNRLRRHAPLGTFPKSMTYLDCVAGARPLAAPGAVCLLVVDALLRPDCNANPPRDVPPCQKSRTKRDPKADLPPATRRLNAGAVPGGGAGAVIPSPDPNFAVSARGPNPNPGPAASVPEGPTPVAAARSIRRAARSSSRRMRSRRKRRRSASCAISCVVGTYEGPSTPQSAASGVEAREGSGVGVGGTRSRGKRPVGTLERNGAFVR